VYAGAQTTPEFADSLCHLSPPGDRRLGRVGLVLRKGGTETIVLIVGTLMLGCPARLAARSSRGQSQWNPRCRAADPIVLLVLGRL